MRADGACSNSSRTGMMHHRQPKSLPHRAEFDLTVEFRKRGGSAMVCEGLQAIFATLKKSAARLRPTAVFD